MHTAGPQRGRWNILGPALIQMKDKVFSWTSFTG
jgi:hypothetical protein